MTLPLKIVIPLFPGVTQLDFTGPYQFLVRLPDAEVTAASSRGEPIEADGLTFASLASLEAIDRCDVLCVPGGACHLAMEDDAFLAEIWRLGSEAEYVTSVCNGSLILGAAGLIRGRRAACHWAWREMLPLFGAIPDDARVVRDGNVITGGGVTAGIDFALALIAELRGTDVAQSIQLNLEYAPDPPFRAGRPDLAPTEILDAVLQQRAPMMATNLERVRRVAAYVRPRLGPSSEEA